MKTTIADGKLIVSFSCKMDTAQCQAIEKELADQIKSQTGPVVFDLRGVDFVSSMFLRLCIKVIKERGQGNFSVINVEPLIKKVFKIAGLDVIISDR
jgi:anti-anti-sigma factor